MAIEDLRVIGNVLYERRSDGLLYPVRQVEGQKPAKSEPQAPQCLLSGIPELGRMVDTLGNLNLMFNPVESVAQSMAASQRMAAPNTSGWDRVAALGDMLSGVAGVAAPAAVASRAGTPAAVALMEGLLGGSPTVTAARDTARAAGRGFVERMNQPGPVPTMYSNPIMRAPFDMSGGMSDTATQAVPYTRVGSDIAAILASHPSVRTFAGLEDVPHGGGYTDIGSQQRDLLAQHTSRGLLAPEVQPPEQATIDSLLGRDILSIVGDTTGRHTVTHLGGQELINPVKSMAGFQYTDIGNQGYAGASGATSSKLNEALQSVDPYYMSVMMGNQSGDFAMHTGNLVGEAFRVAKIDPKNVPTIDNSLRNIGMSVIEKVRQPDGSVKNVSKTIRPFTDFPSVSDPNAVAQYIANLPTGTQRAAFVKGLDRAKLQQMGVPSIGDVRLALADQSQLGMDWGSTGYRGFTPDTSRGAYSTTLDQSTTYDTGVDKIGRSQTFTGEGKGIPANLMFRDSALARREKGTGGGLVMNSADYKVYESSPKAAKQRFDRQQVDIVSTFREIEDRFGRQGALEYAKQLLSGGQITGAMIEAARKANAPKWMIAAMTPAGGLLSMQSEGTANEKAN